MIEPGLFRHYKGNTYRVLFLATWSDYERPQPDDDVIIYVEGTRAREGSGADLAAVCGGRRPTGVLLTVKWSGNSCDPNSDAAVSAGDAVVIYVALYGDGRLSARTMSEFEEPVFGQVAGDNILRFTRIEP